MNIDTVKKVFQQFDNFIEPISDISYDSDNKEILCNLQEKAYNYDAIVNSQFRGQDIFKSFDAVSFSKDGYVNFIEFKDAKIDKKEKDGIRGKVVEGIHYIERILLDANFLAAQCIPTRFILVYSKEKNKDLLQGLEKRAQHDLNEGILSFSTLAPYRPFIGNRFDEKWKYVDIALSLNEQEFIAQRDKFL